MIFQYGNMKTRLANMASCAKVSFLTVNCKLSLSVNRQLQTVNCC